MKLYWIADYDCFCPGSGLWLHLSWISDYSCLYLGSVTMIVCVQDLGLWLYMSWIKHCDCMCPGSRTSIVCVKDLGLWLFVSGIWDWLWLFPGSRTSKPVLTLQLLELVTDWLTSNPCLGLVSLCQSHSPYIQSQRATLWTSPTKPNTLTPIPGLVRWCTKAPLLDILHLHNNKQVNIYTCNVTL